MSVKTRRGKIKEAKVNFLRQVNKAKSLWTMDSQSERHVSYTVLVEWLGNSNIEGVEYHQVKATCSKTKGASVDACKGNNGVICYHCLSALTEAAKTKGKSLVVFGGSTHEKAKQADNGFLDAVRFLNFGGKLIKIENGKGGKAWGVVK